MSKKEGNGIIANIKQELDFSTTCICSDKRNWFYVCNNNAMHVFDENWTQVRTFPIYGAFACDTDDDLNLYVTSAGDSVVFKSD